MRRDNGVARDPLVCDLEDLGELLDGHLAAVDERALASQVDAALEGVRWMDR